MDKPEKNEISEVVNDRRFSGKNKAKIVKTLIFAVIAAGLIFANFWLEQNSLLGYEFELEMETTEKDVLAGGAVLRVDEDASFDISDFDNGALITLTDGHYWGNFAQMQDAANVIFENVVLIPRQAQFDLKIENNKLTLAVIKGDVFVGLLEHRVITPDLLDQYDDRYLNKLLVPQDTQITINLAQIDEDLRPILFTKLVKEFKYSAVASSLKSTDWVKVNLRKDSDYREELRQRFEAEVLRNKPLGQEGYIANFLAWSKENLTFVPEKKYRLLLEQTFSDLELAIFYASKGDEAEMQVGLDAFERSLLAADEDLLNSEAFLEAYDRYLGQLEIFSVDDLQAKVWTFLLNKKIEHYGIEAALVELAWLRVYEALAVDNLEAEKALDYYNDLLDSSLGKFEDEEQYKSFITYQNQLFDTLFLRHSLFYKDAYFSIKNVLETVLLDLYDNGRLKDELRQAFVSRKIDFLKQMRRHFFDEAITVKEAKEIFERLVNEVDDLMPSDQSGLAVIELFEAQLADVTNFWGYLNDPRYHLEGAAGTHEEKYTTYLRDNDQIWSKFDIQEDLLGEVAEDVSIEEVVAEMTAVLTADEDLTDLEIGELETVGQRFVDLNAVIGGYPFQAKFDRSTDSLSDVYVYGELVTDRPVPIANLVTVLQAQFADLDEQVVLDNAVDIESSAQREARFYIARLVSDAGFEASIDEVSVVDAVKATYRLSKVYLADYPEFVVSFDIIVNGEIATNVLIAFDEELRPTKVEGRYSLAELVELVRAEAEFGEPEADDDEDDKVELADDAFEVERESTPAVNTQKRQR
jgi:hypothetical protein